MNGFYNIIKPIGRSSSNLVVRLKKALRSATGEKIKIGHLGTLDPMASGVLGIAVGSATKLFDYFLAKRKVYVATCVLGSMTDTLDVAGTVIEEKPFAGVSDEDIQKALSKFIGDIMQIPPTYSAKSVDGVRAYRLASKGVQVDLKPCHVTIYSIRYLGREKDNIFRMEIECSGGTYIRSLCRDIGAELGYPAYMGSLERVQNGTMRIEDAVTIEEIEKDISRGFQTLEVFGDSLKKIEFSEENEKKLRNGVKMHVEENDCYVSVYLAGLFYGIGRIENNELSMIAREYAVI